ncbi:MAG TPA: DUF3618 domain-containing protein [Sphingomicrobium sp.]|jgi:ElaB/YqjD/DUF883 family membrane-anchored ribosome-binding protein|nr:DUF3618 domain-containing protein [Sphingomicrobium sp.]
MSDDPVKAAEVEVDRTRIRLTASLQELSRQFAPHRLMEEVWEKAKDKGADLAEDAVDAVRARPYAATGVVAAIAMFIAREPLMDLAGKLVNGVSDKRAGRKRRKATKTEDQTESAQ